MPDLATLQTQLALAERESHLLPRRKAILETIREQHMVSADYLYRNFAGTPASTLRNDLLHLQKLGLILKLGNTRGALYSCPE